VGVVCNPTELTLALGDTSTSNAVVRAVGTWAFPMHLSFAVLCNDPQCTDQVALATQYANAVAPYRFALDSIQQEKYYDGFRQALDALGTQSSTATEYFSTFTFEYDPNTSTLVTPPIIKPVQNDLGDYELVGVGYCYDSFERVYSYIGYYYGIFSDQECILRCKNSACLNSQGYTIVSVEFESVGVGDEGVCYCNVGNAVGIDPDNDSPECADVRESAGGIYRYGSGPSVNVNGYINWLCFRPKVLI
jgi:hypothetical protein